MPATWLHDRYDAPDRAGYAVNLLGSFSVCSAGQRVLLPFSLQRLIAFLALHPGELLRTYVAGCLWPDSTQTRADASLRSALWRAQAPSADLIRATSTHVTMADTVTVDVQDVIGLVRRLIAPATGCRNQDLNPARLTGELLPDWTADDWIFLERERLRQLCLHGLESQAIRLLELGRHGEAIEAGLAAVRAGPLRESAHRVLIQIYLSEGNATEALRQYDWYRRLLRSELGLNPSVQVRRLVARLRQDSPEVSAASGTLRLAR